MRDAGAEHDARHDRGELMSPPKFRFQFTSKHCGLSSERDLELRLEDAFVRAVLDRAFRAGAPVEERARIVELPLHVAAQIPVDAERVFGRGLRRQVWTGKPEFELTGIRGQVAEPRAQLPCAPFPNARIERTIRLDPTV